MAKLAWNSFISNVAAYTICASQVSIGLPKGAPKFDKNLKKLPTPYGLFIEWAEANLSGRWTSEKDKGGFLVAIEDKADLSLILKKFSELQNGSVSTNKMSIPTVRIGYKDSSYGGLAKSLGYDN